MPYKRKGLCIQTDAGKVVKCHKTVMLAKKHLIALNLNVEEARDYDKEYKDYQGKADQIKRRSSRNKARRKLIAMGRAKKGDGKDVDHKDSNPLNNRPSNLRVTSKKANRARNEALHLAEAGARNSRVDLKRIQAAHDTLVELGAVCQDGTHVMAEARHRRIEAIKRWLKKQ